MFMPVIYKGILINYNSTSLAYRVWDYTKHKVYDVAAPTFDEEADPGWWRPHVTNFQGEDEALLLPEYPLPPTPPFTTVSEVIDSSPDDDIPVDDASTMPAH